MGLEKKFWGWGYNQNPIHPEFLKMTTQLLQAQLKVKVFEKTEAPQIEQLQLRKTRFVLPSHLKAFCTDNAYERAFHSFGRAFRDVWRALHRQFDNPPDYVAFPENENQIANLYEFAVVHKIALVPFGGGSSVVGGVEPTTNSKYNGVISVDLLKLDKVMEIDKVSRSARVQAGIFGPALEQYLKKEGLSLRHYPQSFEFSTLGGWIATRSGGHYASLYTHIDEFVESLKMIHPRGITQTRRLPGSGAGPSEERMLIGSEGIFGIIAEAWMRLQHLPVFKQSVSVHFPEFQQGLGALREIAQSGLYPSNARLVSPMEAFSNGLGDGRSTVLILGFESHLYPVDFHLQEALKICKEFNGNWKNRTEKAANLQKSDEKAEQWKRSFLQAPYLRDELIQLGLVVETFETAITWDRAESFISQMEQTAQTAIERYCGNGLVTVRITHIYPDGLAPYFTIIAKGEKNSQLEQWDAIKKEVSDAIIHLGGTITHHHAVGKDHQPYYEKQQGEHFAEALRKLKSTFDPDGLLNPGVLLNVGS